MGSGGGWAEDAGKPLLEPTGRGQDWRQLAWTQGRWSYPCFPPRATPGGGATGQPPTIKNYPAKVSVVWSKNPAWAVPLGARP